MPVVLHPRNYEGWLNAETEEAAALTQPFDNGRIEAYPVSTVVNDPKNNIAECLGRAS
jgi:putative SOS response-associated peptidase YedK